VDQDTPRGGPGPVPGASQSTGAEVGPDYAHIAKISIKNHEHKKTYRKEAVMKQNSGRQARRAGVSSSAKGISKSLTNWTKSLLGMHESKSELPVTASKEELKAHIDNQTQNRAAAIESKIQAAIKDRVGASTQPITPNEEAFIRKSTMKQMPSLLPVQKYVFTQNDDNQILSFSSTWVEYGHGCIAANGFPRCTFDWEQPSTSHWNTSMITVMWETWKMVNQMGGTGAYTISAEENNAANCLAILNRWFNTKRAEYKRKKGEKDKAAGSSGIAQVKKTSKTSRRRVSSLTLASLVCPV